MIIQEPVQAAIHHALDHYAFSDAIFLAERLYAEVCSDDALYLLATCYYRAGETFSAYSVLHKKGSRTAQCKFLLARCCVDLKKYSEAELALTSCSIAKNISSDEIASDFGESGSFACQLLAYIFSKTDRVPRALDSYTKSLRLNPFLWSSYESLINLGDRPDPAKIFSVSNLDNFSTCQGSNPLINLVNKTSLLGGTNPPKEEGGHYSTIKGMKSSHSVHSPLALLRPSSLSSPTSDVTPLEVWTPENNQWYSVTSETKIAPSPTAGRKSKVTRVSQTASRNLFSTSPGSVACPKFGVFPLVDSPQEKIVLPPITPSSPAALIDTNDIRAPSKKDKITQLRRTINPPKFPIFSQSSNNNNNLSPQSGTIGSSIVGGNVRRSSRLFSSSNSVKENNKTSKRYITSKAASKKSKSSRGLKSSSTSKESELNEMNKPESQQENRPPTATGISVSQTALAMQKASADGLMRLLQELGRARLQLGQYHCAKVIETLKEIPPCHYQTGWVLVTLAKTHFELAEYDKAVRLFQDVRQLEPHRLQGMEYYSTALWHLQQEVALSALAQELTETAKNAPQTWCVAGNCFSLQKEHETAIKFLSRAVQVDSEFAYAYTLLGHEHVVTEEMERAMNCFRNAIRIDPRHYNAWYGIGMIYYKQEKFHLAEVHFKRALTLHPQSSVLMCHIGVVQHALKKTDLSLLTLNKAISMDPKNPLCKFHRASIYFSLDRHQEALKELEELKEIVPKESLVFFLIGKVHKKLGNTHLALMNFSWAMDLDPKGANNQIKEAIDKRYNNDDEEALSGNQDTAISDDVSSLCLGPGDQDSSHDSSVMDNEEIRLQAMESDESY